MERRMIGRICIIAVTLGATLLVAGCAAPPAPVELPVELPVEFSQSGGRILAGKWWQDFEDPQLSGLIEEAFGDNFSLRQSWDRLQQARSVYVKGRSGLFPDLEADAGVSHSSSETGGVQSSTDKLRVGVSAGYELDLWGGIRSSAEASRLDLQATAAELESAAMSLAAEVAQAWFTLVEQNNRLRLLEQQLEVNSKGLELVSAQFRTGQVPMADLLQQRQLVESKQGEKIQLVAERDQSEHLLAILLGDSPGSRTFDRDRKLVSLPVLPATGPTSELLLNRPDIRSALLSVQAADRRVAVAIADRYPSLSFSLGLESSGVSTSDIFSNYLSSLAANLIGPLFDGGSRRAEVKRTKSVASEALNKYGQTILEAVGEVEDSLIQEKQQLLYLDNLNTQLDLASRTIVQVKESYLKGVEDYQRVLTGLQSKQSLEQKILLVKRNLLINRVSLCRALGSGWSIAEENQRL